MSERCDQYAESLSAYLDGELSDREAARLRAHLEACPDCRQLLACFSALSEELQEDMAEPPAALAEGVMDRILAWEEEDAGGAPEPVPLRPARTRRSRGPWRGLAVAACLALLLGGAWLGINRFGPGAASQAESVTLEESARVPAPEAPLPPEAPLARESGDAVAAQRTDSRTAVAYEAPAEAEEEYAETEAAAETEPEPEPEPELLIEAAPEEDVSDMADSEPFPEPIPEEDAGAQEADVYQNSATLAAAASHTARTWEAPAYVPAGREADFEALIRAAAWPEGVMASDLSPIDAVEYNGIIYEFLSDPSGSLLFWRDAAESVDPIPSPGTPQALWDIVG